MIKILFFASLQEKVGREALEADKAGLSIAELKSWLEEEFKLASLANTMTAVNESYTEEDVLLKDGDTVALIPPVSGG
ncbi:molybdopterin converting factor subunit 1 [Alteribacillus sp. HJP-4]|uniref:molybdopterin converting factor subunit 1 n=1 Tax=Alteribacillus sp. HJP-4 TaxID=2775394 RepID=UPI0035CCF6E3